jgi:peptidoglycan/LPS O-acetylase OafA/YrhL
VLLGIARAFPDAGLLVQGGLSLFISIALAWVIYITVEKPCARLRRKLSD